MTADIRWDRCRREDHSINLEHAYEMTGCRVGVKGAAYLNMVETIMPIQSRQAAAVAIATAMHIDSRDEGPRDSQGENK